MDSRDPEQLALLLVQQFLREQGYESALNAVEKESKSKYMEAKLSRGSMLLEMVYTHIEAELSKEEDPEAAANKALAAEEERLLQGGRNDYPAALACTIRDLHPANIISVTCWPDRPQVVTGSGDSVVRLITHGGDVVWQTKKVSMGGVLCLALSPPAPSTTRPPQLLVGWMDGTVALLNAATGELQHAARPHRKYAIRLRWTRDGSHFLSASWDGSLALHHCSEGGGAAFSTPTTLPYATAVHDVEVLPDGHTAVASVRDSNYLRLISLPELTETDRVNMNAKGDDHVSFSATALEVSPCQQYLLVCTDGPRLLMLSIQGWRQVRNFYGLAVEKFHQPSAAWHSSGHYILAAAAAGWVYIFHVGSAKLVHKFKAHESNTRGLSYDPQLNTLATCSFDKTVKIYAQAA
ncbi:hypothetical protein WJX74_001562 [Apatococcus lobatus]|uniref:Uncharacterized protein n=1 Tax=Apatococcus lobatus TaxID=904363 RepID=A0AAW1RGL4_9CHLO